MKNIDGLNELNYFFFVGKNVVLFVNNNIWGLYNFANRQVRDVFAQKKKRRTNDCQTRFVGKR